MPKLTGAEAVGFRALVVSIAGAIIAGRHADHLRFVTTTTPTALADCQNHNDGTID